MEAKISHFVSQGRTLLVTFYPAQRLHARSAAVLLCNPFGEEAARAHRQYRVLATTLAVAGYPALRFDYGCTGDSFGDGADATIAGWEADVASSAAHLRTTTGARHLIAVGLRLGGTIAALAASRGGPRLRHLLLWDPIVDGAAYLRELAARHRAYMREEMGEAQWQDRLKVTPEGFPTEALGTEIQPTLMSQLASIDLATVQLRADHVTVVSTNDSPELVRLRDRLEGNPAARWLSIPTSAAWNSDAGLNAAIVPMNIVQALLARIEEVTP